MLHVVQWGVFRQDLSHWWCNSWRNGRHSNRVEPAVREHVRRQVRVGKRTRNINRTVPYHSFTRTSFSNRDPKMQCCGRETVLVRFAIFINISFPSSLVPLFQNESKCETFHIKMTEFCMQFHSHGIQSKGVVSHLDLLWNRGTRYLGNGLFHQNRRRLKPAVHLYKAQLHRTLRIRRTSHQDQLTLLCYFHLGSHQRIRAFQKLLEKKKVFRLL